MPLGRSFVAVVGADVRQLSIVFLLVSFDFFSVLLVVVELGATLDTSDSLEDEEHSPSLEEDDDELDESSSESDDEEEPLLDEDEDDEESESSSSDEDEEDESSSEDCLTVLSFSRS